MANLKDILAHIEQVAIEDLEKIETWLKEHTGFTPADSTVAKPASENDPDNDGDDDIAHPGETGEK